MPVLAALGLILSVVVTGVSVYDIISTGEWQDWTLFDWVVNIGLIIISAFPLLGGIFNSLKALLVGAGVAGGFLGKIAGWLWAIKTAYKTSWIYFLAHYFRRGGFLFNVGRYMAIILRYLRKPWVLAGVLFASTMANGIGQRVYQLWGSASMKALEVALNTFQQLAQDEGIGNPVNDAVEIIRGSKSALPECFTAIWGAVGADVCIGLIISTFQYCLLLSALIRGYRLYGRYGDRS